MQGSKSNKNGIIEQKDADGNVIMTEEGLVVGRGKTKRVVTEKQVSDLASLHCTNVEIAEMLGISEGTLNYNFKDIIIKAKAEAKSHLRKAQWKSALDGNVTMQIWLGKNILGQSDQPVVGDGNEPLPWEDD